MADTSRKRRGDAGAPAPIVKRRREDSNEPVRGKDKGKDKDKSKSKSRRDGSSEPLKIRRNSSSESRTEVHSTNAAHTSKTRTGTGRTGTARTPEAAEALAYFAEMHKAEDGEEEPEGPDPAEQEAMHAYSVELLKMRQKEEVTKQQTAPMKAAVKELRQRLYAWMVDEVKDTVAIPKAMLEQHNAQLAAAGMPDLPPYIRLFRNNKDATILAETVRTAMEDVTRADVEEVMAESKKALGVTQAFCMAVVGKVRLAIREYTQQVKQQASLPKGVRATDVEDAPAEVASWAIKLHTNEQGVKILEGQRKAGDSKREANLKLLAPLVSSYFARAGLVTEAGNASQRIVIRGAPYRLVRRVSTIKHPIRFGTIDRALWHALGHAWHMDVAGAGEHEEAEADTEEEEGKTGKASKSTRKLPDPIHDLDTLEELLEKGRSALVESVTHVLSTLPPTHKSEIKLYDVAKPRIKA